MTRDPLAESRVEPLLDRMLERRRYCWAWVIGFVLLAPPVIYGAARAWDRQANRVEDWLPAALPETQQLDWFVRLFGSDEYLALGWDGCVEGDPRLDTLQRLLAEPPQDSGPGGPPLFYRVFSGASAVADLTAAPVSLSPERARGRLRGWLIGLDGQTTCVIALASREGIADRHAAIAHARRCVARTPGLERGAVRFAGPTYDTVAVDEASKASLLKFNLLSWAISLALLLVLLRSVSLASQVFLVAFGNEQLCLAMMHYSGAQLDSILLLSANLTFVVAVAGGVHLVNYARDAAADGATGPRVVAGAVRRAWRPTLLATTTTCLGMLSLTVSQLAPVRSFGVFSAVGVGLGVVALLFTLPAMITLLPPRRWTPPGLSRYWDQAATLVETTRYAIVAAALVALIAGLGMARNLTTTASLQDLFRADAPVLRDQRWFEETLGVLVPVEVALRFRAPEAAASDYVRSSVLLRQVLATRRVAAELRAIEGIDTSVSAATFTPPLAGLDGRGRITRRALTAGRLYAERDALADVGFFREDADEWVWRVGLRTSSDQEHRYQELLADVRETIQRTLDGDDELIGIVVTGGVPLVHRAQQMLLDDLKRSFATAIATVGVVMMLVLRSVTLGAMAIAANVFPIALVFGVLGAVGLPIEVGAVLTASVALGISVDDALHFLSRRQAALRGGASPSAAVAAGYRECGGAMVQTTLVLTLGLLVFAASDFVPIARFAWMLFCLLSLALLSALFVLPAILLTVRGRA